MNNNNSRFVLERYKAYLTLECSLSPNTIEAYLRDTGMLFDFFDEQNVAFDKAQLSDFEQFMAVVNDLGLCVRSQARIVSSVHSFYRFLLYNNEIANDPTELLEQPKLPLYLPEVLSIGEVERILNAVDLSTNEGTRNRAIFEILYGSGLRVSELVSLKLSNISLERNFMRVEGKGSKERLVPLSQPAAQALRSWLVTRNLMKVDIGHEDFVFLNRNGRQLTRMMIFKIVKKTAELAGIEKNISPHTFRHSFATHLLEGGANLRAIQEMLGHESILTTEIYTHIDTTFLREEILSRHPRNQCVKR